MTQASLYERLGGAFAIAAVVNHFSDALVQNPIVGQQSDNPALRDWHTNNLGRLPGLKFMRTLWVCNVAGGPFEYTATKPGSTPVGLEAAHRDLKISPAQFDEVAAELGRTLAAFKVPEAETGEVLAAFAAHKGEVTEGLYYRDREPTRGCGFLRPRPLLGLLDDRQVAQRVDYKPTELSISWASRSRRSATGRSSTWAA